jgi:hypothetical protein
VNGGVLVSTGQSAATALGLPNGSGSYEITATTDAATLQSIIDNPANFYFNVHSSTNPGGVARGQLVSSNTRESGVRHSEPSPRRTST